MGLSAPWADSILIIALRPVKTFLEINPMVNISPWADSLDIISLQTSKNIARY